MRCFVVAGFLLTSASRGPSAIAELLVSINKRSRAVEFAEYGMEADMCRLYFAEC